MNEVLEQEQEQVIAKQDLADVIVRYRNVKKAFGDSVVLNDLNIDVRQGEKIALIGPSGSGKTTIIRMLMTLEKPSEGTIEVDGEMLWHKEVNGKLVPADEKHLRKVRGNIGMVFQQYNLFPHMTILKNCTEAPIHVLGLSKQEAQERAKKMLEKVAYRTKLICILPNYLVVSNSELRLLAH